MDRRAWWAAVHGVTKSWTQLSDFTFTFHFHALEKELATCSSVLAWRIPGMAEPGGLPSVGSHRVRHDWSDLAAALHFLRQLHTARCSMRQCLFFWPRQLCWAQCQCIYTEFSSPSWRISRSLWMPEGLLSFFLAALGLCYRVQASGRLQLWCVGFSLLWLLWLQSLGSGHLDLAAHSMWGPSGLRIEPCASCIGT